MVVFNILKVTKVLVMSDTETSHACIFKYNLVLILRVVSPFIGSYLDEVCSVGGDVSDCPAFVRYVDERVVALLG